MLNTLISQNICVNFVKVQKFLQLPNCFIDPNYLSPSLMMFRSLHHKHTLNYFFLKTFQNEINVSRIEIKEETTTASTTSTESTTTVDNRPVKEATLYNFVADQGK